MDNEPEPWEGRREEIRRRLDAIHTRIDELKAMRQQDDATQAAVSGQLESAQRQVDASRAAAQEAAAASVRAFRWAAEAHEHAAVQHERVVAAGFGGADQHERQAAFHRAAAAADRQRAEHAQSLLQDKGAGGARAAP